MAPTSSQTPSSSTVSYLTPPSSSETPSSSASPPNPLSWDVFLSFRGETRNKFTSHLYQRLDDHGIRTFKDDQPAALRIGDVISDALVEAIRNSKTYIVIFSEDYASSSWCLDELVKIYNCHTNMNRLIVGVYYNIEPSVVRRQTGKFKKAFKKHKSRAKVSILKLTSAQEKRRSADAFAKVRNWKETLAKVADFSGQTVPAHKSEADIITDIVERILTEINPKTLHVAEYPVGLDSRVEFVTALLSSGTEGFIRCGIYGMGGVGKTTLAKAVYNRFHHQFKGSCFLEDVRVESQTPGGIERLQRQLINNVLKCSNIDVDNVGHGIELIKARICSKKILIVIDDLDDQRLLRFLEGPFILGSIVIITTRNEDLLDSIQVERRYKVNKLGDVEASQLFSQHALGSPTITDTLKGLSTEILECAGGLPLALTAFGRRLCNNTSEDNWRWLIDVLKRSLDIEIEKSLLISFTALKLVDPNLQSIFLDIACFFIGQEKEEVVKILETYYAFVNDNIDILEKRSLLEKGGLEMHHLVSGMGRKIVRNNSLNPRNHSRLWVYEDMCSVLKHNNGTDLAIEGIIPHILYSQNAPEEVSFTTEAFRRMSQLRFLYLNNVTLTGCFEQTFEDLRWLCWEFCPLECLPPEFHPQKLVTLALPRSKLRTMLEVSQVFENLKSLNLSYSMDLTTTPDFTKLQNLETLNLEGCKSLEEVHISIGSLGRLVSLNLSGCVKLRSLDLAFCHRSIELFSDQNGKGASDFRSMERLPNKSNLKQLKKLNLNGCSDLTKIYGLKELASITTLHLGASNSSLLASTLTEQLFQIYSKFGHQINIHLTEFPNWISRPAGSTGLVVNNVTGEQWLLVNNVTGEQCLQSTMSSELLPHKSHNFLGMILCFKLSHTDSITYSVKNTTHYIVWGDKSDTSYHKSLMVIVPRSILDRDCINRIELTADTEIYGIHLLYKLIGHATTVNVGEVSLSNGHETSLSQQGLDQKSGLLDRGQSFVSQVQKQVLVD